MKIFKKLMALMLALIMCVSLFSVIACNKDNGKDTNTNTNTNTNTDTSTNTSTGSTNNPNGKVDYLIQTKTIGGMVLPNVTLAIYEGDDMKEFGTTNEDGFLTISLPRGNYTAKVREVQKGYKYSENGYPLNETGTVISLASSLIEGTSFPTTRLELGTVMNDFEITDIYDNKITLSGLFNGEDGIAGTADDKQMVLLNFFFTTCGPCVNEIPYMMAAYEEYKDKVAILGLDPYPDDDAMKIKLFAEGAVGSQRAGQDPLNFPVADAPISWAMAIADAKGTTSYPTNIIIDRFGVVTLVEVGGITSQTPFNLMFEFFSKVDYKQTLVTDMEQIMPTETPNVNMPSSEEIGQAVNSGDITVEYTKEDNEMAWPFVIKEEENGNKYIFTSNSATIGSPKINSFSQINGKVTLKAGQALAFDYFARIGEGDIFYVFVEGKDIFTISGTSEEWEKCYAYVAKEDGEYEFSFIYLKDAADDEDPENDGMMIDNVRVVNATDIDKETYISYYAATKPTDKGIFTKYATIVLGDDGFYHVDTKDGPYLLVEMINSTQFSKLYSVAMLIYGVEGYKLTTFTNEELLLLESYANYASNSSFYGLCPVTPELKNLLVKIATELGDSKNENEWLEFCEYFGSYGTTKQIENPIKGLADFCAFDAVETTEENPDEVNYVVYDRGQIMPRGLLYKFVPTKSGVYRITSSSEEDVDGWIFLDTKKTLYQDGDMGERLAYEYTNNDPTECTMVAYMEAGKAYYIDIAFYDVTMTGSFTFTIKYIAEEFKYFVVASHGPFSTDLGDDIDVGNGSEDDTEDMLGGTIIAGGVDVILGDDNIYYVLGTHKTIEEAQKQANSSENAYLCTDKNCKSCQVFARNYYAQLTLKTIRNLYERYNEDESVTSFNVAFRDDEALARALDCIEAYILADEAQMETRALSTAQTLASFVQTRLQVTNYIESLADLINAIVIDEEELENGEKLVASDISDAFDAFESELKTYDDFYHSVGSKLYADFLFPTSIFQDKNLQQLVNANAFDFSRSANDQQVLAWISGFEVKYIMENLAPALKEGISENDLINIINGKKASDNSALLEAIETLRAAFKADKEIARSYFKAEWQADYEENFETYQVEDVLNGILHGARFPSENDQFVLDKIKEFKATYGENSWQEGFLALWGTENFATNYQDVYKVDEVVAGKYHGESINLTYDISAYFDDIITAETHPDNAELHGCVVVDKELAEILQVLMDKFTFEGVEHSWTKLCYYYITLKA